MKKTLIIVSIGLIIALLSSFYPNYNTDTNYYLRGDERNVRTVLYTLGWLTPKFVVNNNDPVKPTESNSNSIDNVCLTAVPDPTELTLIGFPAPNFVGLYSDSEGYCGGSSGSHTLLLTGGIAINTVIYSLVFLPIMLAVSHFRKKRHLNT